MKIKVNRNPKLPILLVTLCISLPIFPTQAQLGVRDIIRDPSVSLRCRELIQERGEKLEVKQKTQFLLRRSEGLRENAPEPKVSIKRKLKVSAAKLRRKLFVVEKQIDRMEENIVRKGCPGITI